MQILLVDDHSLIRSGLKEVLSDYFDELNFIEAASAEASLRALRLNQGNPTDLAIVDLFIPGEGDFSVVKTLCDEFPDLPVIVLSASEDPFHIRKCIDLGASGYVPKSTTQDCLLTAVELVMSGGIYLPEINQKPTEPQLSEQAVSIKTSLTKRQMEILEQVAQGHSNKQIAADFELSENTVKAHVSAILKVMELDNRTQISLTAQRLGLTSLKV